MNHDPEKCYRVLGLDRGASAQEVKAAYRDLAKVWHPDRFAHDPRLQGKAQEKLKEINEAYEQLTSPGFNFWASAAHASPLRHKAPSRSAQAKGRTVWPLVIFVLIASTALLVSLRPWDSVRDGVDQAVVSGQPKEEQGGEKVEPSSGRQERKDSSRQRAPKTAESLDSSEATTVAARPIPTVNLTIDPTTGLIATPACPIKHSITFVSGEEPHQYCDAQHPSGEPAEAQQQRQNRSRWRTLAKGLTSPVKLLQRKERGPADQSPEPPTGSESSNKK